VEIIMGVERRRRWRIEDKLRIVAEAAAPGAIFSEVARRHDVSRGLLWTWRRQVRRGVLAAPATFMPVRVMAELPAPGVEAVAPAGPHGNCAMAETGSREKGRLEIGFPDGVCIRVIGEVSEVALRRVMTALRS